MAPPIPGYLEIAAKRTFAGAIDWPGWCRSGRNEDEALVALIAYGPRYAKVVAGVAPQLEPPAASSEIEIVERLTGNSGTDFGVPAVPPTSDRLPVNAADLERLVGLLQAAWRAFDAAAEAAVGLELRKGPRGGGRDLDKMQPHILEAEQAYLRELGGTLPKMAGADTQTQLAAVREVEIRALRARAAGEEPALGLRRMRPFWTLRYFVRYSAWHALDHAWEIEDRRLRP